MTVASVMRMLRASPRFRSPPESAAGSQLRKVLAHQAEGGKAAGFVAKHGSLAVQRSQIEAQAENCRRGDPSLL